MTDEHHDEEAVSAAIGVPRSGVPGIEDARRTR